jgi:hypothetical protein
MSFSDFIVIHMNCCQDHEVDKIGLFSGHTSCLRRSDTEEQSRFLQERSKFSYSNSPCNMYNCC